MDLSVFLDILHSGMPEASKDHVFKSILDEDTYKQLIQWQLTNNPYLNQPQGDQPTLPAQNQSGARRPRPPRRNRNAANQHKVADQEGYFKRSFLLWSACKGAIIGVERKNIKDMKKRGVILTVNDLEDSKVEVIVASKDQEQVTLSVLEVWDIAGRKMKKERPLNRANAEIVLSWSTEKRAGFIIRTGCNILITKTTSQTSVSLQGIGKKEADAAVAQILVENKNSEEAEEYTEDEEEEPIESEKFKTMNILLIGMEAVGKSLLVNSLTNYTKYNRFGEAQLGALDMKAQGKHIVYDKQGDNHEIGFVGCDGEDDLAEMPMIYSFNGVVKSQPYEIRLIDTEGIRVSGVNESLAHVEAIIEASRKLGEIHAVVLVMKAGEDRLENNFCTVVKKLLRSFHRDLLRNVLFCFTRSGPNFSHELIAPVVKKFTEQMHEKEDMLIYFSKESSFCFDNKGFLDLYASKKGFDVDLKDSSDYWDKSAEQAKRFFEKVSELPCFDARRIVPTLPENLQIRPISVANLGELLSGIQQTKDQKKTSGNLESVTEVRNTASRELLESDLEADVITQLLKIGGPDAKSLLKKIIKDDDWEMFFQWIEAPVTENSKLQQAAEASVQNELKEPVISSFAEHQTNVQVPVETLKKQEEDPERSEPAVDGTEGSETKPVSTQPKEETKFIDNKSKLEEELANAKLKSIQTHKEEATVISSSPDGIPFADESASDSSTSQNRETGFNRHQSERQGKTKHGRNKKQYRRKGK